MFQDIRLAFRQLKKSPSFTLIALLTLALGIGATSAIFTVVNSVLLRPLEFPAPDRLVVIEETGGDEKAVAPPNFLDWEKSAASFAAMTAVRGASYNLTGSGDPQRIIGARVTAGYFNVYGVAPLLGRSLLAEEDAPGKNLVVVLSYGFWQRQFGGAADAVGRTVTLSGQPHTIVGVMPASFQRNTNAELWAPMAFTAAEHTENYRGAHYLRAYGRLKPSVTLQQAQAEIAAIAKQLETAHPENNQGRTVRLTALHDFTVRDVRRVLFVLLAAVACVLLIACANIANLQLARATTRLREFSIRAALGASRGRLFLQLIIESLCLALAGGALGLLLARWGLDALLALAPDSLPRAKEITLDGTVLGFTVAVSAATGLLFGLVPAWQATRLDLNQALKDGARGLPDGSRGRLRQVLVVLEVAISLVLLVGAGLLGRSFQKLTSVDPGFNPAHALTASLTLPEAKYGQPAQQLAFARDVSERFRSLPGVSTVGYTHSLPFVGNWGFNFFVQGRPAPPLGQEPNTSYFSVSPEYFQAMGIRLLRGRYLAATDTEKSAPVCVINETLAKKYFPGEDPLGKRIRITNGNQAYREIVGIVTDVKEGGLDQAVAEQSYEPYAQSPYETLTFVLRTDGTPLPVLLPLLRAQVLAVDKEQPLARVRSLETIIAGSVERQRFAATLLGVFSGVALVIAAVGIFGIMAYTVNQRTSEIGIRMALGASPGNVLRMVLGQGMTVVLIGICAGLACCFALTRLIQSLLFNTSAYDPLVFAVISAVFTFVALLACLLPAHRATKVDPLVALRSE